jgi:hypothetical protein
MRDGADCPSVILPYLTTERETRATCNIVEEGKRGSVVGRGRIVEKM